MKNNISTIKNALIYLFSFAFVYIGFRHFTDAQFFLHIMPDYLPWHLELVYLSGFLEITLGLLILFDQTRKMAAWGLILLLIAVFPANIYLVQSEEAQQALDITREMSILRLPFQLVFITVAYWFTKD